jgi:hypothetical protein
VFDPHILYRGYRISIFGVNSHWAFSAEPTAPGRPMLFRSTIDLTTDTAEERTAEAKRYVDEALAF